MLVVAVGALTVLVLPVVLMIAAVLLERFESRILTVRPLRRVAAEPPALEAAPDAQRHLRAVPDALVIEVPAGGAGLDVDTMPLPRAS